MSGGDGGAPVLTDDVSLQVLLDDSCSHPWCCASLWFALIYAGFHGAPEEAECEQPGIRGESSNKTRILSYCQFPLPLWYHKNWREWCRPCPQFLIRIGHWDSSQDHKMGLSPNIMKSLIVCILSNWSLCWIMKCIRLEIYRELSPLKSLFHCLQHLALWVTLCVHKLGGQIFESNSSQ